MEASALNTPIPPAVAALQTLALSIAGCIRCAKLVRCRSRVVPGAGAAPAMVAFVGIAPGRLGGDRTGIPFSGDRSGNLLRAMIARTRLPQVFITNLVRCNPRDGRGRNRDPSAHEIANCRIHLEAELALVKPRIVVCLGRMAWHQMAGRDAPFDVEQPAPRQVDGRLLYPMYHPAYINRGAYPVRSYQRDFARLRKLTQSLGHA